MERDDDLEISLGSSWNHAVDESCRRPSLRTKGNEIGNPRTPGLPVIYLADSAHRTIMQHGIENLRTRCECGGILVGSFGRESTGTFIIIRDAIRALDARERAASVTFTHETWDRCSRLVAERQDNSRLVGWYHTHPGFGAFYSNDDTFIQRHFFAGENFVGIVVDPKRNETELYQWVGRLIRRQGHIRLKDGWDK